MERDPRLGIYSIQAVVRMTGVPATTLRYWEKKHGLLAPMRTDGGHRLYSSADVERVNWLKTLIDVEGLGSGVAHKLLEMELDRASEDGQLTPGLWLRERRTGDPEARRVVQQELDTTRLLLRAADALASRTSLSDVLDVLCESVLRALPHSRVSVGMWDEDAAVLETAASKGDDAVPSGLRLRLDELSDSARRAINERIPVLIDYDALAEGERGIADRLESRFALWIPLLYRDRVVGLLALDDAGERRPFPEREIAIALGVAAQAAVAIENARLFEAEQTACRRAEASEAEARDVIRHAAAPIYEIDFREPRFRSVNDALCEMSGYSRDELLAMDPFALLDEESGRRFRARIERALAGEPLADEVEYRGQTKSGRETFVVLNVQFVLDDLGIPAGASVVVHDVTERRKADLEREALLHANTELLAEMERHAELQRVLADTASALASASQLDDAMPGVLRAAADALGASGGLFSVKERGGWRTGAIVGRTSESFGEFRSDAVAATMTRIRETREAMFVSDVEAASDVDRELARRLGYRSIAAYPVLHRDQVAAVIAFSFEGPRGPLSDEENGFLARLAFNIGVAEENSRLYQNEHRIAETLQEALLALPEKLAGIEFAHTYHSATESERVGGDFYDLFQLSNNMVGVTIGDVAGKGLRAAVLTSLVKNTIRAHASEKGKSPHRVMELTNDVVFKATPAEAFATVFFGILDCRDGHLVFSNAAHTTAAVVCDGAVAKLGVTGPLLGAFPGPVFGQAEAWLEPDALLFLYTDGLTEARRGTVQYGEDRLFEFLSAERDLSARGAVDAVIADVTAFSHNQLRDDLAILAVKRAEFGPEETLQQKLRL